MFEAVPGEKTFQYEESLPSLPLPPLDQTLRKYLESGENDRFIYFVAYKKNVYRRKIWYFSCRYVRTDHYKESVMRVAGGLVQYPSWPGVFQQCAYLHSTYVPWIMGFIVHVHSCFQCWGSFGYTFNYHYVYCFWYVWLYQHIVHLSPKRKRKKDMHLSIFVLLVVEAEPTFNDEV